MDAETFKDKTVEPNDPILKSVIGDTNCLFLDLRSFVNSEYAPIREEWKYYGQKFGWHLKMFYKKRNLFFIVPKAGYFLIAFVFGDKAVQAIEQSDLPENIINDLLNAKKYGEGRGLSIDVKRPEDLKIVKKLIGFKVG